MEIFVVITLFLLTIVYMCFCITNLNIYNKGDIILKFNNNDETINKLLLGTHDSLSSQINNFFSQFAKTQKFNLELQLKSGVRFFDLRFKIIDNMLVGHHAFINLNINHEQVFKILIEFLNKNPNNYIIIVLKNEDFKDHDLISNFLYNNYIVPNNIQSYFLFNNSTWTYIPTLKEAKGKIFVLNHAPKNIENKPVTFTYLPWADNREFEIGSIFISDIYKNNVDEKLQSYDSFINKIKPDKFNIFFSSMQYNNILGIRYNNNILMRKIKIYKDKNYIFVGDFIESIIDKFFNS